MFSNACSGCLHIYLCTPIFPSSLLFLPVIPVWTVGLSCAFDTALYNLLCVLKRNMILCVKEYYEKNLTTPLSTLCVCTVHNFCCCGFGLWYVCLTCAYRSSYNFTPLPCFRVWTYEKTIKCVTVLALWHLIVSELHIVDVNFSCRLMTVCELQGQGWTGIKFSP
jgi:hypothetical protein